MIELTAGAIDNILNNKTVIDPILQVVNTPYIDNHIGLQEFKIYVSDGIWGVQSIIAKEKVVQINSSNFKKFTIIKLTQFETGMYDGKVAIIINDFETILLDFNGQIGKPKKYISQNRNESVIVWQLFT
ncbi:MAG: hypothetical protein EZS28_014730 [Streblomastix strix]|uniref:Replication factor-A protein 1 N-terminal domain-containing protein n=1 Tax=Streblomastix strix TaxID=222440 RepID=A0A5J4W5C8_9EUKA|nr:MAG: hypothetical protein EZS28_014730 [Streblomastix strix]